MMSKRRLVQMYLTRFTALFVLTICFKNVYAQSQVVDSLKRELGLHASDTIGIKAMILLGAELSRSDLAQSREYLYQGIRSARHLNTDYGLSALYSQLTTSYQGSARMDSARKYFDLLEKLSEGSDSREIQSNYHLTAGLFYKNSSQFELALPHMLKALTYMTGKKYELNYAGQLLNIGNTYTNIGDIAKATHYHLEALKRFEGLKNKRGESFCLQSLGNDFLKLKRYKESRDYFEKSELIKQELKDTRGLVSAWNGLGNMYFESGKYSLARDFYQKALHQARQLKLQSEESKALYDIGLVQFKMDNHFDARISLLAALPLARQRGDSLLTSKISLALVNLQRDKNNALSREHSLLNKIEQAIRAGDQNVVADSYFDLSDHHFQQQEFEKAYHYLKLHQQLADTLRGNEISVRFREIEQRYQNEKHEKEIALLKKDRQLTSAIIAKQNANQQIIGVALVSVIILSTVLIQYFRLRSRSKRKEEVEKVRNNIARDLHDDIGSALSSIHIISQLAIRQDSNVREHLLRISDSAARMMEGMGDIVWSINPENDSLDKLIVKMKEFAQEILEPKNIHYVFDVNESLSGIKLDVEKRKNLFLIFKESLNNAAKYSEGSEVQIRIHSQNGKLQLTVRDNGKGFEAESVRPGNGLLNMAERAKSVNGTFIRNASPGMGTEIIAEMPIT
jgi:two-component system, NarL family, sensor histidine kinase UhpB